MSEELAMSVSTKALTLSQEMAVDEVVGQVNKIQEIMQRVMKLDVHYGTIPGTPKPSLYKAGAEKLGLTFRLVIDESNLKITEDDLGNGHKNFRVVCPIIHAPTGMAAGAGIGSCNTMETKYRYRNDVTDTGLPIPKDAKDNKGFYRAQGFMMKKFDDGWKWCKIERVEHDNPADYYNTCEKMAKKRAFVDAILTSTAASDFFTQDVEDMDVLNGAEKKKDPVTMPVEKEPEAKTEISPVKKITENQRKRLWAIAKKNGVTEDDVKQVISRYGYSATADITMDDYEKIIGEIDINKEG